MENRKITVFLIDDDDLEVLWLKRQIASLDFDCDLIYASSGEEALELVAGHQVPNPCIIFLDINMPGMGGHEFLSKLRNDSAYKSSVVFMMSSSDSLSDKQKAYDKHVAGYLIKSCDGEGGGRIGTLAPRT